MNYETILIEKRGEVDWVTLNRPQSLNAINTVMATELGDYFGRLFNDASVRVVLLSQLQQFDRLSVTPKAVIGIRPAIGRLQESKL